MRKPSAVEKLIERVKPPATHILCDVLVDHKDLCKLIRSLEVAMEELNFLSSNEAYHVEESDPVTGYFDVYMGPQDSAASAVKRIESICSEEKV